MVSALHCSFTTLTKTPSLPSILKVAAVKFIAEGKVFPEELIVKTEGFAISVKLKYSSTFHVTVTLSPIAGKLR